MNNKTKIAAVLSAATLLNLCWFDSASAQEKIRGGRGYFMVGWNTVDIDNLNASLEDQGYTAFSEDFFSLGAGGHAMINRIIIGGEGHGFIANDEDVTLGAEDFETKLGAGYGFFNLGYLVRANSKFTLYPLAGIGGGGMNLKITERNAPAFENVLENPRRNTELIIGGLLLHASLGADFLVSSHEHSGNRSGGWLLGLRAGYVFAPSSGDWHLDEVEIPGGPDFSLEGPYLRLMIGGGAFRRE